MSRNPLFMPLVLVGGLVFGSGLAFCHMARPEVVIDFLTLRDFGLLFVMLVSIFGVGWELSGICPGATDASLGVGNWPILYALGGMCIGAYAQGVWRSKRAETDSAVPFED